MRYISLPRKNAGGIQYNDHRSLKALLPHVHEDDSVAVLIRGKLSVGQRTGYHRPAVLICLSVEAVLNRPGKQLAAGIRNQDPESPGHLDRSDRLIG